MKKTFMLLVALLTLTSTWATTIEKIGKFSYELDEEKREATLVKKPNTEEGVSYKFSSDVVIPGTITYRSVTYTVKTIGYQAFIGCNLTSVSIGEGVERIENFAFENCPVLDSVSFPSTLKEMGNQLFFSTPLRVVTIFAATPPSFTYGSPFNDMAGTLEHLYVPYANRSTYRKDDNWSSIANNIDAAVGSIPSMTWDITDLQKIHLFISGSQTIKYITVTADAPNAGQGGDDYVHFLYDYEHSSFSLKYGGSLTFSSAKGKFRRIVINIEADDYMTDNLDTSTGWSWKKNSSKFIWSGEPASSVTLTSIAGTKGFTSGVITSIEFTFESAEPDPVPSPIEWDQTDIESLDLYASGESSWSDETVKDITVSAVSPAEGDYCSFNTYLSNSSIRIGKHGRLTFTHISDNLRNIVITCDGSGNQDLSHLAASSGWVWNDTKQQLTWTGNAGTAVLESDGSSDALYIGMITSITFGFEAIDLRKETELRFEKQDITVIKDEYDALFDPQTGKTPLMTYTLKVYDASAGEGSEAYSPSQINLPVTFSLPNNNVISITPDDEGNGFTFVVNDYGDVVVTVSTKGNEEYQPASTTMTIHVVSGKGPNEEALLYFANGDKAGQILPEGYTVELKTGDLLPKFELRRADQPETVLEPVHTVWGAYRNRLVYSTADAYFRAITAGDDVFLIQYSRYEDGDANGEWLNKTVRVQVSPSQAAMSSSISFTSDPSANGAIAITATFDGTNHQVNINGTLTDEQVDYALKKLPFGTAEWEAALPNSVSFEVSGKGRFAVSGSVQSSYELRVKIRGTSDIRRFTSAQMANGSAYVNYDVKDQSAVVIYVADPNAGSSSPRRAPAEVNDEPLAALTAIDIAPIYPVAAEADPENTDVYYTTHYNETQKYLLPEGTEAYAATISGTNLVMTKVAEGGQTIPANNAFILKSTSATIELIPTDEDAVTVSVSNDLTGTDIEKEAPADCYVLRGKSSDESIIGIGFYRFIGTIDAHKAYIVNSDAAAPDRMPFVINSGDIPTASENIPATSGRTVKRIENGQLVIILENGTRYNAQGQMVK